MKCRCNKCMHCQQRKMAKKAKEVSYAELWIKAWKYAMVNFLGNMEKLQGYGLTHENIADVELRVKMMFGPWMDIKRRRYAVPVEVERLLKSSTIRQK